MADLDVRLDDAHRLGLALLERAPLRPHLDHADVVLLLVVEDAEGLALGERGEVRVRVRVRVRARVTLTRTLILTLTLTLTLVSAEKERSDCSSTAFGLEILMKSVVCGCSLTKLPFWMVALFRCTMSPSFRCMFSIIQKGR